MPSRSLLKVLLSIALLVLVAINLDLSKLGGTLAGIKPWSMVILVGGFAFSQVLSSVKWWTIARSGGIDVSYPDTIKAYFIGMFVNLFGLGMVGGDVTRGLLIAHGLPKKTEGIASVIADRIHGLVVLCLIAGFAVVVLGDHSVPRDFLLAIELGCLALLVGWFIGPWLLLKLPEAGVPKIIRKLKQVAEIFPRRLGTLGIITGISVVFHLLQISLHAVMAWGVGAEIGWHTLLVVIPLVNIASSLPISWNGLGVRENSYMFFLTPAILSPEQAVAFGAMWLLAMTTSSAIGGVVALITGDLKLVRASGKKSEINEDALLSSKRAA